MVDKFASGTAGYLHYTRPSELDNIPDNYAERIMALRNEPSKKKKKKREVKVPEGFAVAPAYNKGGYQVIPKEDL